MKSVRFTFLWWRALAVGLLAFYLLSANVLTRPAAGAPNLQPRSLSVAPAPFQDGGTTVNTFSIPTANSGASNITTGPDGNFWFTETNGNKIGQVTADGAITEFPLPTANSQPFGITSGPDGRLWLTELGPNQIGTMTLDGTITEYPLPTAVSMPMGIATGSDDALWFTEKKANKIGRITTGGSVTEFVIPTANSGPQSITQGQDGNMWFTENTGNNIGRITPTGTITEYPTPISGPEGITGGFDGNMYVSFPNVDQIGKITTSGTITQTPLFAGTHPSGVAAGTDGSIYFALPPTKQILKVTPSGGLSDTDVGDDIAGITFLEDKTKSAGIIAGVAPQSNKITIFKDSGFDSPIKFTKTLKAPVEVGQIATYEIHVINQSSSPLRLCQIVDDIDLINFQFFLQKDFNDLRTGGLNHGIGSSKFSLQPGEDKKLTIELLTGKSTEKARNTAFLNVNDKTYIQTDVFHSINPPTVFSLLLNQLNMTTAGQPAAIPITINAEAPKQQARALTPEAANVNLSASVFPVTDSITTSFSPNPAAVPGSTTLTVNTTASTPVGTYTFIITGTADSVTHNAIVTLMVTAPGPDFALGFDSPTIPAQAGSKAKVRVNINRSGGFTGAVTVSPPPSANGIKPKPADPITTSDATATFKVKIGGGVAPGNYPLTFTAQDSTGKTHTGMVTLVVQ